MNINDLKPLLFREGNINLQYLMGLSPEDAIKYFQSKGIAAAENAEELIQAVQKNLFAITGVHKLNLLQDIYDEVLAAIENGTTIDQFKQNIYLKLVAKGYIGADLGEGEKLALQPWRLDLIFRQNLQTSYMAGRYKQMWDNRGDRFYWQYIGILDNVTRPVHAAIQIYFEDKVLRCNHPWWDQFYPPNGYNCRCRVRAYTVKEVQALGLKKIERMNNVFETDPGFDYNPGQTYFKPDLSKYSGPIAKIAESEIG